MKLLLFSAMLCATPFCLFGQIGIGTSNPNSALDIQSTSDSMPALELNPQSAPVGTAMGQISVINDQLFLYDETRSKWLSVESTTFNFGDEGNVNNGNLEYAGDIRRSGPRMPARGTIVYVTMNSNGGNQSKGVFIDITDSSGIVTSHLFELVDGSLVLDNLNIDIEATDFLQIRAQAGGGPVNSLSVSVWLKQRN